MYDVLRSTWVNHTISIERPFNLLERKVPTYCGRVFGWPDSRQCISDLRFLSSQLFGREKGELMRTIWYRGAVDGGGGR